MTQKKKITMAVVALVAVLLIAVTSVVLILAALNATVSSNITISYTAYNVDASITASYQVSDGAVETIYVDAEKTESTLVFETTDETGVTKAFQPSGSIEIGPEDVVVVHYVITNTDDTGVTDFSVSLEENVESINMKYEYCVTTDTASELTYSDTWTDVEAVENGTPLHVYVRVSILEDTQNATFDGTFNFTLTSNLND
ncbi:MAG: hypothetical protein IJD48_01810 [Clostridia bacterium]|nr:hypothetical protein [Clostridia bacterium]